MNIELNSKNIMKRYFLFLLMVSFLSLSFFSFKSTENKIGNMLSKAIDEKANNTFVVWVYLKDKGPNAMAKLNDPLSRHPSGHPAIRGLLLLSLDIDKSKAHQQLNWSRIYLYTNLIHR